MYLISTDQWLIYTQYWGAFSRSNLRDHIRKQAHPVIWMERERPPTNQYGGEINKINGRQEKWNLIFFYYFFWRNCCTYWFTFLLLLFTVLGWTCRMADARAGDFLLSSRCGICWHFLSLIKALWIQGYK